MFLFRKFIRTAGKVPQDVGDALKRLCIRVEQAEQVFSVLKLRNVPTRLVRYPRSTSHGFSRGGPPDLRVHRLNQILSWWQKYLQ